MEMGRAIEAGDASTVEKLLGLGVDPNAPGGCLNTPLHLASVAGHEPIVKILLRGGADPNIANSMGTTPLHWASENGRTSIVKILLCGGANPNIKNVYGSTPLLMATHHLHGPVVKALLCGGANPNIGNANAIHNVPPQPFIERVTPGELEMRLLKEEMKRINSDLWNLKSLAMGLLCAAYTDKGKDSPLHPLHMAFLAREIFHLLLDSSTF
jgi:ankyrin repeat protein